MFKCWISYQHFHWHSFLDELEQNAPQSIKNWISFYWHKTTTSKIFWSYKLISPFLQTHSSPAILTKYCNSYYSGISQANLNKLQCIQNSLASIITNTSKFKNYGRPWAAVNVLLCCCPRPGRSWGCKHLEPQPGHEANSDQLHVW